MQRKKADRPGGGLKDDGRDVPPVENPKGRDWRDDISALYNNEGPSASHRVASEERSHSRKTKRRSSSRKEDRQQRRSGEGKKRSRSPRKSDQRKKKKKAGGSSSEEDPPDKLRGALVVPPKKKKKKKKGSSDPSSSSSSGAGKKRKSKRDRSSDKKRKKKRRKRSDSSSQGTTDSDDDFYGRESRKFASLLEKAQKQPGKLLRSGLEEMGRYMASRVGDLPGGSAGWREQKVTAYLSQVLFTQYSPQSMGVRNSRELLTLAEAIDQLMAENFAAVGDILMQRFKATESSLDAGWTVARHQELIRPEHASLTSPQERAFAARAALQHHRLETAVGKRKSG